ncbi:MAG TPA: DUF3426 domain-containing protein [Stellaceae bacterium]|nr:DUF3426 domain-containing protein [Stellaceae bacterium]
MIVTCPACSTRYLVDERNLGATGRMVRCSQCGHSWYEAPPTGEPLRVDLSEPEAPPPLPGERRGLPVVLRARGGGGGWGKTLAILFLVLAVLGVGAVSFAILERGRIMAHAPATRPLYARLESLLSAPLQFFQRQPNLAPLPQQQPDQTQFPAPGPSQSTTQTQTPAPAPAGGGLVIQGLAPHRATENNIPVLVISGQIVNSSSALQVVPRLRVTLHDAKDNTVASWTFAPDQASLPPGGSESFETSMAQPSDLASGVVVTFEPQ